MKLLRGAYDWFMARKQVWYLRHVYGIPATYRRHDGRWVVVLESGAMYYRGDRISEIPWPFTGPILREDADDLYGGVAPEGREVL